MISVGSLRGMARPGALPTNQRDNQGAMKNRKMLDKWAANIDERRVITEFWAWLETERLGGFSLDIEVNKCLDKYHGIDQKELEKERRALLDSIQ